MLVSPGLEITVTDESQYVSTAVGTVPFILFASAENKIFNESVAPYTTKANAGKLLAVTSQRDLITNFGYPSFKQSSAGTSLHGNELNEYGLMTAYSALGSCNRAYIIRADIDLNQLIGTSVRPIGDPANGIHWLDLSTTDWGIYEWDPTAVVDGVAVGRFDNKLPILLTSPTNTFPFNHIPTPIPSIGAVGSYAITFNATGDPLLISAPYLFYKHNLTGSLATSPTPTAVWSQVGSPEWQMAFPTVSGTVISPVIAASSQLTINTITITLLGTTPALAVQNINSANIPGVEAGVVGNKVVFYVNKEAMSDGFTADGKLTLIDGTSTPLATMGIAPGSYYAPISTYGTYLQAPDWRSIDSQPRPAGSVWAKTSTTGAGANLSFKMYDGNNDTWLPVTAPIYANETAAIFGMDPNAGGNGIPVGSIYVRQDLLRDGTVSYLPFIRESQGATRVTGTVPSATMVFQGGDTFTIQSTRSGTSAVVSTFITLKTLTVTAEQFVADVLSYDIPEVNVSIESNNAITFTHTQGGYITLTPGAGIPLQTAGFTSTTIGVRSVPNSPGSMLLSNFNQLTYTYALSQPYTAPKDGTLWFYNSPLDVDIMINETTGWKGYQNVPRDVRGFNLQATDPNGPILAPLAPTTQSTGTTSLVPGDLWVNTGDLENFPVISRWTGSQWKLIDNADVVTQNGIVFADARWDTTGTIDPAAAAMPTIKSMLTSNYVDLDCPDHRLYPRGTLLFNLRRSGFNVKQYVSNYFNADAYPNTTLPVQKATWVTSSGLENDGSPFMGANAQRVMITKAMKAALDGSETIREETFGFNLLACPGYPELIPNMVMLNNDRKNTGFILGDTPMHLPAKIMNVTEWSTQVLTTADPYMAVYYPSCLANDLNGNTIVMPPSHMILRAAIKSDNVSYPWFAFAGTRRGLIDNATDIGYVDSKSGAFVRNGLNQGMRDALYQLNINPVTLLPGVGLTNYGNKTRQGVASAMDRVNVARLVNYIRTILAHVGDGFLFEPNDGITRSQIKQVISSALNDLIAKRGVYDYLVICDESNNDNARIARNELYVDIAIEPMKDVEFIYIPIRLKNPGGIKASGK